MGGGFDKYFFGCIFFISRSSPCGLNLFTGGEGQAGEGECRLQGQFDFFARGLWGEA